MAEEKKSIFDLADKFGVVSPFGNDWVKEDFKNSANVGVTISFKGKVSDKIETNKKTLIEFLISGEARTGNNNLNVELKTTNSNISFSTSKWTNVDYGFTLKTYVTGKQEGSFTFQFKVNGKQANSLSLTFATSKKSKYKILLFGGIDYANDGSYGSNYKLGEYLEKAVQSKEYNIPLQKGDIKIVNSPLFSNESGGKDVYKEILDLVKENFDTKNGTLILYGYSWGGQLMLEFLKYFKESGINITLLITVDALRSGHPFSTFKTNTENYKIAGKIGGKKIRMGKGGKKYLMKRQLLILHTLTLTEVQDLN